MLHLIQNITATNTTSRNKVNELFTVYVLLLYATFRAFSFENSLTGRVLELAGRE